MDTLLRNGIMTLVILAIVLSIVFFMENRRKKTTGHIIGICLFTMAMVLVFDLTGVSPLSGFHTEIRLREISLLPVISTMDMVQDTFVLAAQEHAPVIEAIYFLAINILGNVMLFVPLGFFLPLLWNRFKKFSHTVLAGALISLLIECSQLFLSRGTDIDDFILNTLGTMVGYGFFLLFRKLFPRFAERVAWKEENSLWRWIPYTCMLIPYLVTVAFGFYDRALLFAM